MNQENEKLMEEYEKLASEVRLGLESPFLLCSSLSPLTLSILLTSGMSLQSLLPAFLWPASPPSPPNLSTQTHLVIADSPVARSFTGPFLPLYLGSRMALVSMPTYVGPWTQRLSWKWDVAQW